MSFIKELRASLQFQQLIKDIEAHRPTPVLFDPSKDNTEEWKKVSGFIEGFDFVMFYLKGDVNGKSDE